MKQTIIIGHVALIQRSKKQWFTLDLIKALREKGIDVVGIFAGECRDTEYMEELNNIIRQYELERYVVFLGRRNDIPDLLKMIDMLIIPSSFEGFPLAGLEAAAAGVPVIACDAAGAKEFIDASGDGVVFKEDDIESAVSCTKKIVAERQKMTELGKTFAYESSMKKYAERLEKVFSKVI